MREKPTPDGPVGDFIGKETYKRRLSWAAQDGRFLPPPTPQNLKSLQRGLHWCSVTHTVQMVSMVLYFFKAASLKQLLVWEWWVEGPFHGQGRG